MTLAQALRTLVLLCAVGTAAAQPMATPAANTVQLAASAAVDVPQDLLAMTLSTQREGTDAALVQAQLKTALDAALTEARKAAEPGLMALRTGSFNLSPRYGKDGKLNGWLGSAELVLEGRDMARIAATAGRVPTLTVSQVGFGLSREQRQRAEAEVQAQAIARFRDKAGEVAKAFGFAGYTLREVAVHANDQGPQPMPRMLAMEARAAMADAAVPVAAGKTTVTVNVSGTVQLQ